MLSGENIKVANKFKVKTRDAKHLGGESNGTEIFRNKITEIRVHVVKFPSFSGQSEPETSVPFSNSYSGPLSLTSADWSHAKLVNGAENAVPISIYFFPDFKQERLAD